MADDRRVLTDLVNTEPLIPALRRRLQATSVQPLPNAQAAIPGGSLEGAANWLRMIFKPFGSSGEQSIRPFSGEPGDVRPSDIAEALYGSKGDVALPADKKRARRATLLQQMR